MTSKEVSVLFDMGVVGFKKGVTVVTRLQYLARPKISKVFYGQVKKELENFIEEGSLKVLKKQPKGIAPKETIKLPEKTYKVFFAWSEVKPEAPHRHKKA